MPSQQNAVSGLFSLSSSLAGALSSPQLGGLLNDEIALAVDTYLDSFPMVASALPSLSGDIANLHAAISANALAGTAVGQAIGTLAFNVTMNALTTAQPTI